MLKNLLKNSYANNWTSYIYSVQHNSCWPAGWMYKFVVLWLVKILQTCTTAKLSTIVCQLQKCEMKNEMQLRCDSKDWKIFNPLYNWQQLCNSFSYCFFRTQLLLWGVLLLLLLLLVFGVFTCATNKSKMITEKTIRIGNAHATSTATATTATTAVLLPTTATISTGQLGNWTTGQPSSW